jgi:hypothetical protein
MYSQVTFIRKHNSAPYSLHPTPCPLFLSVKENYGEVSVLVKGSTDRREFVNVECLTSWPSDLNWRGSAGLWYQGTWGSTNRSRAKAVSRQCAPTRWNMICEICTILTSPRCWWSKADIHYGQTWFPICFLCRLNVKGHDYVQWLIYSLCCSAIKKILFYWFVLTASGV